MAGNVKLMTSAGGGVVLDTATTTATDVTVKVPAQNCTLGIQGPAFSAWQSANQAVSASTWTKVLLQSKNFDTASCFDNTTNYRFTPNVAGYYSINAAVAIASGSTVAYAAVYKNGTEVFRGPPSTNGSFGNIPSVVTNIVYLNGSTDYVEQYVYAAGASNTSAFQSITQFSGALVRAA